MKKALFALLTISILLLSCKEKESPYTASGLHPAQFASTTNKGENTELYKLTNTNGMEICVTNLGMRVVSIMAPGRDGTMHDVVQGFDNINPYMDVNNCFGAVLGRYANRIANGTFVLDRVNYELRKAAGSDHILHGGPEGFHTRIFNIERINDSAIRGTYLSKNKEEGFPGELLLTVNYTLTADNSLDIEYEATCNMPTVINISNHTYFNLSGDLSANILDHQLYINADNYTPTDAGLIPTGEIRPVTGSALDFLQPTAIGDRIHDESTEAIKFSKGYDVNYVLNHPEVFEQLAARAYSPSSGITLEVYTTEPGLQLYTANSQNLTGKGGKTYGDYSAFCLETQHFPDSPNHDNFPSTVLRPGELFYSRTMYKFGVEK